ncbi:hypothetical protein OAB00_01590 [Akkermansiaceae bacterium]|nr:hypothetical protein [Akkermansiaceae bacterium]
MRITNKFAALSALVTLISSGIASAHPGPAGHVHGDDWPFGLALVLVAIISAVFIKKKITG